MDRTAGRRQQRLGQLFLKKLDSAELNHTALTFSAPWLYDEQMEQIENGEYKSNLRMLKKVTNPEYERREVQIFLEVAKKRNAFANQGRGILKGLTQ